MEMNPEMLELSILNEGNERPSFLLTNGDSCKDFIWGIFVVSATLVNEKKHALTAFRCCV